MPDMFDVETESEKKKLNNEIITTQLIPPVCSELYCFFFTVNFFWYFLMQQNMALIGFLFSWKLQEMEKNMNIYLRKQNTCKKKKEACMFSTVCTRYLHVALAAYVPMLWERFTFGHSCNYSVVLSKNVSTRNKKNFGYFF